jgi:hypothetical protein
MPKDDGARALNSAVPQTTRRSKTEENTGFYKYAGDSYIFTQSAVCRSGSSKLGTAPHLLPGIFQDILYY